MMVSCPGCNNSYSLDERKISSRGASLTCAQCGTKWSVRPPVVTEPEPPAEDVREGPPIQPEATGPVAAIPGSISCPLCGHTFHPSAQTAPHASSASAPPRPSAS